MELDRQRITKFLYHLGKGLWKSVPVLGPIVEEVFYEQFKEQLTTTVESLSLADIQTLSDRIPDIELNGIENKLENLSMETKIQCLLSYVCILEEMTQGLTRVYHRLEKIDERVSVIPNMLDILTALSERVDDGQQLQLFLQELEQKRLGWIRRLSKNQLRLLLSFPEDFVHIEDLWLSVGRLIPGCGYKEFRFRLHEIEWLGLVERYWNQEGSAWYYRLSSEGKQKIGVDRRDVDDRQR